MDPIQQLHQNRKVSVVVVTHDPNGAARAQRVIHLQDGQVLAN